MRYRGLAIVTGVLVPVLLAAGVVASATHGGPGVELGETAFEIHRVDEAHFPGPPDKPVFVLVMGNDARPGETSSRADALHLIGLNPAAGQATILNIPRDTYVDIPGRGSDKINAAHVYGGPELQAQAVGQLVGVEVPFVVSTGFEGFSAMVDELGGVEVNVPFDMADANSGAFFSAGPTRMDGTQALAFSRNRGVPGGDFRRSEDQALVILAGLAKMRGADPSPANTLRWLAVLLRHGRFNGAGLPDIYRLGRMALAVDPAKVRNVTMPGAGGSAGGASVVFVGPGADTLFADMRDDAVLQSH
ncbi:MAG: LCP family protein [Acidimicrobiales bacterium]